MINITIIGVGHVGKALALTLLNGPHPVQLNLMDPAKEVDGVYLDFIHGISLYPNKKIALNEQSLFLDADYIFYTAGYPNEAGASRLSMIDKNIILVRDIFENVNFSQEPYIIAITNPVDVIAAAIQSFSKLPPSKVLGTGTFLDSIRLSYYLSLNSNFTAHEISVLVLGEHGASQVPIFSNCLINETPIHEHPEFSRAILKEAAYHTCNAANYIRATQPGTCYGVAKCAASILDFLLDHKRHRIALGVQTNAYYQELLHLDRPIYIGLPVIIENGEIHIDNDVHFSSEEISALKASAQLIYEHTYKTF